MRNDPLAALFAELGRLRQLALLESELSVRGFTFIAGVDEVGRGCLAGPVVAGAVILPSGCVLPGLDDSKRVDADARSRLAEQILRRAVAVGIGVVEARQIDADNILRASLEAMRRAVCALDPPPDVLLVDAVRVPGVRMPQLPVVHGDALSLSIAAGSIVAKVHRDRLLDELGRRHPAYGFEAHKGYGTPEHWEALRLYGPCPEHRMTFRGVTPDTGSAPFGARQAHRRGQSG
ncbi:MAG TPA: ribonuclease HII [Thermoanaerobaculia bacterium]|nr:ribonuclease HII [Thermoanaerobaculia bacterium]